MTRGLLLDTYLEMRDRKLIWGFVVVTIIGLLAVMASSSLSKASRLDTVPEFEQEAAAAAIQLFAVQFVYVLMTALLILAVLGTAGAIPSMLARGRAEFYLSRPLSRRRLLLAKISSVWMIYGAIIVACGIILCGAIWIVHGVLFGSVLYIFIEALVSYLIWLAITGFVGVFSGSFAWSIMVAFAVWISQWLLQNREMLTGVIDNNLVHVVLDTTYYILPKFSEQGGIAKSLAMGTSVESWLPAWSTILFGIVMIFLAISLFSRKNY